MLSFQHRLCYTINYILWIGEELLPMKKLMLGNEAVARGAYEAGVRVVSSYPGTPSTEITEFCAAYPEIDCEWAPNEKVAWKVIHISSKKIGSPQILLVMIWSILLVRSCLSRVSP